MGVGGGPHSSVVLMVLVLKTYFTAHRIAFTEYCDIVLRLRSVSWHLVYCGLSRAHKLWAIGLRLLRGIGRSFFTLKTSLKSDNTRFYRRALYFTTFAINEDPPERLYSLTPMRLLTLALLLYLRSL